MPDSGVLCLTVANWPLSGTSDHARVIIFGERNDGQPRARAENLRGARQAAVYVAIDTAM